ncbi:MAG TPA: hypothetical protein DCY13_22620, partial [Verrucomicrobiales bacterium]|nr:hypothetical protein [Verrucomicrobiales bacterium]
GTPGAAGAAYHLERPVLVPKPDFVTHWREIATGGNHVLALVNDGDLVVWGHAPQAGLCCNSGTAWLPTVFSASPLPRPEGVVRWSQIAAGAQSSFALSDDGRLFVWGEVRYGELGFFSTWPQEVPRELPPPGSATRWAKLFPKAPQFALADDGELY